MLEIEGRKLYTLKEVAEQLKVTPAAIRLWIKNGRMQARRIGRPVYITEDDLQTFLDNSIIRPSAASNK